MRILFTSTSYPSDTEDWKGLFILRMLDALAQRDELSLAAWCPPGPLPKGVENALRADDDDWLRALAAKGGIAHLLRKRPAKGLLAAARLVSRIRRACLAERPHLYHVNWLQCALGLPSDGTPALVTVLGTDMQILQMPLVRAMLLRRFRGRKVAICPNAEWMVPGLERAFGQRARVSCVPFGIDESWYRVVRRLNPDEPARWLCVTRLTAGKIGHLFDWAAPFFQGASRELHLIGPRQDASLDVPAWVRWHDAMTPTQLRENCFPGAAGLVSLSTHPEGRPQVMLEAMAAGLPILASSGQAHTDLVQHRRAGWICGERESFGEGLGFIEDPENNQALGRHAREEARRCFGDWNDCAARYASLYEALAP
ncbi:glycosyltransferase family 4 protein [Luteimonas kalidii]|uniref:Glycosyltransferase family 4 protein n=1 Tax=Luteimonas kalidii TaxID=3042025 RepID=A0ABT6JR03_9GAMM|nr:glycosyltransferase family 4 protein [Luteimonas kalidii]MDH5833042.1 glycosyltransferase family 4 protein [Luteimonas kalidii]